MITGSFYLKPTRQERGTRRVAHSDRQVDRSRPRLHLTLATSCDSRSRYLSPSMLPDQQASAPRKRAPSPTPYRRVPPSRPVITATACSSAARSLVTCDHCASTSPMCSSLRRPLRLRRDLRAHPRRQLSDSLGGLVPSDSQLHRQVTEPTPLLHPRTRRSNFAGAGVEVAVVGATTSAPAAAPVRGSRTYRRFLSVCALDRQTGVQSCASRRFVMSGSPRLSSLKASPAEAQGFSVLDFF